MKLMGKRVLVAVFAFMILLDGFSSVSASTPPAKIVSGFVSSAVTRLMKWAWSLKPTPKIAISGRPMMKFESGYTVETVFDGSKLGIEPFSVEELPSGELLILDSANSNLYRISSSLSQYTRPKLVAGSAEGYSGHVDGKLREARMNHPKGIAVDDRGNIYVADTMNMAIRKISDTGVTTIAGGGKWSRGGGHVDGPSDEAKFSNDFDVVYVGSSCSLLVIDRGNRAIREIQLHFDDCAYQYGSGFPLGIAVLFAAGFFGYMLALLQKRVGSIVSSQSELKTESTTPTIYQKPPKSVIPPLIQSEDELLEKQEEGFFGSLGKLFVNASSAAVEIFGSLFPAFKRNNKSPPLYEHLNYQGQYLQQQHIHHLAGNSPWQSQESFQVPKEDVPPAIETRTPTPKKTYAFMSKDANKMQHQLRQSRVFYTSGGWDGEFQQQQQQQQQQQKYQHHRHQHHSSGPQTYYEQSFDNTKEIVFGAVQEQDGGREPVVKPTKYADSSFGYQNVRFRSYPRGSY